jgi:predicted extracellular nuclease
VRVEGIVTRVLADLNGFYLQEEDDDADTDPFTSEGVFIAGDIGFSIGDLVTVEGTVVEVEGETTINASNTTLVSSNNPLPASTPVTLPTATVLLDTDGDFVANLEQYEGMLVNIPTTLSVTELFQLDRFGTIRVSEGGRLSQFTQGNAPDAAGFRQHLKAIAARSLVFDDGQNVQNPSPILVPGLGALMNGDVFRMGDTYSNTTGVLSYSEDQQSSSEEPEYRVHLPDTTLDQTDNPRPVSPQRVGGTLRVASFNVLNFFTTLDTFPDIEEVGPLPSPQPPLGPRGADTNPQNASPTPGPTDEYDRQLAKLVQAIVDIDADIVGLIELENDFQSEGDAPRNADTVIGSGVAIEELVAALNARLQADVYEWVVPSGQISTSGEFVGSDAIAVGFIYQPATVGLVGSSAVLDTSDFLDPNASGTNRNRAALAQTFQHLASGESFTAVVNHFKSKGASGLGSDPACLGDPPTGPDCDQFDGQGYWNNTRTAAARVLIDWLATDPTGSGDGDVLILGDLNAYAQEDPIIALIAGEDDTVSTDDDYTNLAAEFLGAGSYSFVFDGQTGTLDYALASASLRAQVAGVTEWHINADEADAFDYNLEFGRDPNLWTGDAFRASDHDPVLIGLDLAETVPGTPVTKDDCKKGGWRSLARADGSAFRNQGQCIRYVNTGR